LVDDLGDAPHSLVRLEVVLSLLRGALQPRVGLRILGTGQKARLLESVWHLDGEAIFLLSWVQSEHEASWVVPLSMGDIAPLHELVIVKGDFSS